MATLDDIMDDDLENVFFNTNDFAKQFTFSRVPATPVNAIFNNAFVVVVDDVESLSPAIEVSTADIPGVIHGDTFTNIETSVVYNVIGIQPDGTGMTVVVLSQD